MTLAQRYARWWIRNAYSSLTKALRFGFLHDRTWTVITFRHIVEEAYLLLHPSKAVQVWGASVPPDWDKQKN